jgi:hypothetical protein
MRNANLLIIKKKMLIGEEMLKNGKGFCPPDEFNDLSKL